MNHQKVKISLNDRPIASLNVDQFDPREYVFALPAGALRHKNVLTFKLPDAAEPSAVSQSTDDRPLGVALYWLDLPGKPAASAPPAP